MRRRLWQAPRGGNGYAEATFSWNAINGLPKPYFSVSTPSQSFALSTEVKSFEESVHVLTNTNTWFTDFYHNFPSGARAIAASGRYNIMALQPITMGLPSVSGAVRASDGTTVDTPMVVGTSYSGIVLGATPQFPITGLTTQPVGSVLALGSVFPTTSTAITSSAGIGTQINTSTFTAPSVVTSGAVSDFVGLTNGTYDAAIQQYAQASVGQNIGLRFGHEMNGGFSPWGVGPGGPFTAPQFISLWNHVRSVWRAEEATLSAPHIPWIWCVNISVNLGQSAASAGILTTGSGIGSGSPIYAPSTPGAAGTGNCVYVGDANCEFIGIDGYSYPYAFINNGTFRQIMGWDLDWLMSAISNTIPVIITEVGIDATTGSAARVQWFSDMAAYLNANSTRMQGFNYFDHAQGGGGTGYFMDNDTSACEGLLSAVQSWAGY